MLLSVEVILLVCCLISQTIYRIFFSKTIYTLHLAYGSLFVMLNAALLLEHEFSEGEVFFCIKEVEEVAIYLLIIITILMMLTDLLGLKRPNKLTIE